MPCKIATVSSTDGSSTIIGWNLLSKAVSFSIYFLYSFKVVVPIIWISPFARDGFNILAAFIEWSASPAPIILCISSITNIIFPSFLHSSIIDFILASNCPLNWVPAMTAVMSKRYTSLFKSLAGTFPLAILKAKPCAIAVFPTPGSPIRHGLFLERLFNICIILSISSSLPITLSIWLFFAFMVRFVPYVSNAFLFLFGFVFSFTFCVPLDA